MNKKKYYNNSGLCRQCHFSGNLFLNPQHSFRVFLTFGRTVRLFSHSLITRFLISYIGTNNRRVKEGKNIFRQNKLSIYLVIMKNPVVTDLFFQYITKSFHNFQLLLLVHFLTSWSEHIMNNIPGCKNNEHYLEVLQLYRAFLFCFFTDALFWEKFCYLFLFAIGYIVSYVFLIFSEDFESKHYFYHVCKKNRDKSYIFSLEGLLM